ncbi:phosphatase PAP2 family protein [Marinomonas ostreistagni]|uniref:phosphatase PAP2 family protein n=1 Tax=Marinomonas ostreistagni TaxID=359209 RepID=UPI0019507BEA|nr:phosphatase PAP2 family protein [Marinomonas ostreistagni]MBM6550159.1 phosphatase PAP2 family protein [Marinomonas ostreistagni]
MSKPLYAKQWRLLPLFLYNLAAILLLLSWLWPTTRALWDAFDNRLFTMLNSPLEQSQSWALVWAVGSVRLTDIAVGIVMLTFFLRGSKIFSGEQLRHAFIGFFVLLIAMLLIRVGFTAMSEHFNWGRPSPSMIFPDAIRMSEMFPGWVALGLKDSSGQSFPGDHASVVFLWALNLSLFASGWRRLLVWSLAGAFMMPRLVAGAHWGSDDFVGGLLISLLTIGWACYTPFLGVVEGWLVRKLTPIFNAFGRFMPFSWFQFFNPKT